MHSHRFGDLPATGKLVIPTQDNSSLEIEALDGIFAAGGVTPIAVTRGLKW